AQGAVPAAIAVIEGRVVVGASEAQLRRLADPSRKPAKAGSRDLAAICAPASTPARRSARPAPWRNALASASSPPAGSAAATAASIAEALRVHWDLLESPTGSIVVVPPPSPLPREEVEPALAEALREAASRNLPGKEVTPFLLGALSDATAGKTRAANLHLLEKNAHVAAQIATALALASSRD